MERIKAWAEGRLNVLPAAGSLHRLRSFPPVTKPVSYVEYDRQAAEAGGTGREISELILIRTGANLGFAGGNNVGLRYVLARDDFDYVWLLNNDTVVNSDALSYMVERMHGKPDAGICGSTLLYYDHPEKVQALGGGYYCKWIGLPWHQGRLQRAELKRNRDRAERWMNYIVGASMLVSRKFLRDIGLMCEDYFLYFEETDWALRAEGKFSLVYAPESVVYHKVGASIGTSSLPNKKSLACDYYSARNRLLFTRRFFPEAIVTVWLCLFGAVLTRLLFGRIARAKMFAGLMIGVDIPPFLDGVGQPLGKSE
ncbi:glycosyltransferase [Geopsychrobacter electrodiphilus]|uniref:glycosyltransferase n=1 Tax=Geopsychrobacter electrodiphilus TaxID=225196 RepID=UPI001FDFFA73|nr:glycosyltransferase family 2 protein [Geopsychrobacter electrodiphilus]